YAPPMLTASDRASTVFAVPGRSSSSTWPPEISAARTSRISSGFPWTTRSTFAARRAARSIATASAGSSALRSTAGSIAENDPGRASSPPVTPDAAWLDGGAGMRPRAFLALLADGQVVERRLCHLARPDHAVVDPVRAGPGRLTAGGG